MRSQRTARLALTTVLLTVAAVAFAAPSDRRAETIENGKALLAGVTLESTTAIPEIHADPDAWDGKVVQVEGTIVEICSNMGCWVELRDAEDNAVVVKVDDGVVDFRELVAASQYMVAEGVFQKVGEHGAQVYIMEHGAVVAD